MTDWKLGVFLVCAMIVAATGVAGLMTMSDGFGEELDYEPETQRREAFIYKNARGVFPGVDDPKEDEVFNHKRYEMSWTDTGTSGDITTGAEVITGGVYGKHFRFCFAVKTVGGLKLQNDINEGPGKGTDAGEETERDIWYNIHGFGVMEDVDANGCFNWEQEDIGVDAGDAPDTLKPHTTNIFGAGIPHGSILRVSFEHYGRSWIWEPYRWQWMARDEALLRTALGHITKDREGNYEVGETALITVTIPYVKTETGFGFYLDAYHLGLDAFVTTDTGATINRLPITSTTQTLKIPIKSEYFVLGSMDNQIEFKLFNELYPKDAASTDIVDIREKAPPKPKVSQDKEEYFEGDTVTVSWECSPNAKTNLSIVMAKVVAWIGGVEVYRESFSGSNEKNSASFTAPIAGFLDYRVSCIDSAGRGSGNDEMAVIHNVQQNDFCTTNPTHPSCLPPPDAFPLWELLILMLAIIGAIFVVIIAAFLMNSFGIPPQYSILVSVAILIVLILVILVMGQGAIDKVMQYLATQVIT